MPEHVHLLINESFAIPLDQFIKSVKQETSRRLKGDRIHLWQKRYYDANIHTDEDDLVSIRTTRMASSSRFILSK